MDDFDKTIKQISGPINVVRLEGEINGVKKIVYLFMDWHEDIHRQTECTNIFSKDINKYFVESFIELNNMPKIYDFFMEVRPTDIKITEKKKKTKMIYLEEVLKLFTTAFSYESKKNKVYVPDVFKNVRLHYLDVRDYLKYHVMDSMYRVMDICNYMWHNNINNFLIVDTINFLKQTKGQLNKTIYVLSSGKEPKEKNQLIKEYIGPEEQVILGLAKKIKMVYNHKKVKDILVSFYTIFLHDLIKISDNIDEIIIKLENYEDYINNSYDKLIIDEKKRYWYGISTNILKKITMDIFDMCNDLFLDIIHVFAKITDLYCLRRLLDKDYITNAIIYSGALHSETYIGILLSKFGFKITHTAYSLIENIDRLNKEVIERFNKNKDIFDLFARPFFYQCSDITHFPENFS